MKQWNWIIITILLCVTICLLVVILPKPLTYRDRALYFALNNSHIKQAFYRHENWIRAGAGYACFNEKTRLQCLERVMAGRKECEQWEKALLALPSANNQKLNNCRYDTFEAFKNLANAYIELQVILSTPRTDYATQTSKITSIFGHVKFAKHECWNEAMLDLRSVEETYLVWNWLPFYQLERGFEK